MSQWSPVFVDLSTMTNLVLIIISLVIVSLIMSFCNCRDIVDVSKTITIQSPHKGVHFGYSVHLQRGINGKPGHGVIGAPKRRNAKGKLTGSVYRCSLEIGTFCHEYNLKRTDDIIYPPGNGELLGSVIVGDDEFGGEFFTCAPRQMSWYDKKNYLMKGTCYQMKNSTDVKATAYVITPSHTMKPTHILYKAQQLNYYEAAFGQVGFDIYYSNDSNEIITGAPGMSDWSGTLLTTNLRTKQSQSWPARTSNINRYSYFGYTVSIGRFQTVPRELWYVAGVPRGFQLKGQVVMFVKSPKSYEQIQLREELFGEQFGSYFGASIAIIPNRLNRGDDILVGAPMMASRAGLSWDEGCVYYYRNSGGSTKGKHFESPQKLFGTSPGGRFGAVLANLGDLRLDSSNYIAIAAPYEHNDRGCVYVYVDNGDGVYKFSQKLNHQNDDNRGFGMSISNTLDLDGNLHDDFAVGSYGSDNVVILHTYTLFDFTYDVTSNTVPLNTTLKNFTLTYCFTLRPRNKIQDVQNVSLILTLLDDGSRVINKKFINQSLWNIKTNVKICNDHVVELRNYFTDLNPLRVVLKAAILGRNYDDEKSFEFEFAPECGNDNVCNTDLSIIADFARQDEIILGLTEELELNVTVTNRGEPAFRVELILVLPNYVTVTNLRECNFLNDSIYQCVLTNRLITQIHKVLRLNVAEIDPYSRNVNVSITLKSLGIDMTPDDNDLALDIPVVTKFSAFIDGISDPEVVLNSDKSGNALKQIEFSHIFNVENAGPSALPLRLHLLIPKIATKDVDLFEIRSIQGVARNILITCDILAENRTSNRSLSLNSTHGDDRVYEISCLGDVFYENCMDFMCDGGLLAKSSETATFTVSMVANVDAISKTFKDQASKDNLDKLRFVTIAILDDPDQNVIASSITIIDGLFIENIIPVWIYIISTLSGISLLSLLIFILYKLHGEKLDFFKRKYKEQMKLQSEELLIDEEDEGDDMFRTMQPTIHQCDDVGVESLDDCGVNSPAVN